MDQEEAQKLGGLGMATVPNIWDSQFQATAFQEKHIFLAMIS